MSSHDESSSVKETEQVGDKKRRSMICGLPDLLWFIVCKDKKNEEQKGADSDKKAASLFVLDDDSK